MAAEKPKRRRTRVARPTRRGAILGVSGLIAIGFAYANGRTDLLPVGVLITALPLLALAYVRFRPVKFSATRTFTPAVVAANGVSSVQVDVANLSQQRSPAAFWRDTWPWKPFVTVPAQVAGLAAGGIGYRPRGSVARLHYEAAPSRRGVLEVGPLIVDFSDPFGLADGAVLAEGTDPFVVTPALVDLPEGAVSIAAEEGPTRMRQRRAYGGEDDLMTREYRQGDAMRRVHWRASAHHGELMVRQEEQRSHAEARIVLDTRRTDYRDARGSAVLDEPDSNCFEWAISMVGSLALYLVDRGFIVEVIETGPRQLEPLDDVDGFLRSLAAIELTEKAAESLTLLQGVARPDRSQGSLFAVLSGSNPRTVERLIAQRPSFDLAVALLVDPWPSPLFDTLRDAGWICVQVHPEDSIEDVWLTVGAEQDVFPAYFDGPVFEGPGVA